MRRLLAAIYWLAVAVLSVLLVSALVWWIERKKGSGDIKLRAAVPLSEDSFSHLLYNTSPAAGALSYYHIGSPSTDVSSSEPLDRNQLTTEAIQHKMTEREGDIRDSLADPAAAKKTPIPVRECELPPGGFRGWQRGMVSKEMPSIAANCSKIFAGDEEEISRVKGAVSNWTNAVTDQVMQDKIENCVWLRSTFTNNLYNTKLERDFPMAFIFVVHDSPQQVLRLLRLLYRPQNAYCIHYDVKSKFGNFFENIARCFDNVMIASKTENVIWGHYTILQAQLNCMSDLLQHRQTHVNNMWRYVINLCGKELPLVTNRVMVKKVMKLNRASSVIAEPCAKKTEMIKRRLHHPVFLNTNKTGLILDLGKKLEKPPFEMSVYHKSSAYNALSVEFVQHIIYNQKAKKILEFLKQTKNAEEHFYATLYMTPGVPGGYNKKISSKDYFDVAGSFWTKSNTFQKKGVYHCRGKVIHQVCIVGTGDLRAVLNLRGNKLFHNKYFMEADHVTMDCMEQRIVQLNRQEYNLECNADTVSSQ